MLTLDATFFIEEPPEVEIRDGMFYLTHIIGSYRFVRVMRPHTFFKFGRAADKAIREFRGSCEVEAIRCKAAGRH